MSQIPTPFGNAEGKYSFLGTASITNMHAEILGDQGKQKYAIVPNDGLNNVDQNATTPARGAIYLEDKGFLVTVYKDELFAGSTLVGAVPGDDTVEIIRNSKAEQHEDDYTAAQPGAGTNSPDWKNYTIVVLIDSDRVTLRPDVGEVRVTFQTGTLEGATILRAFIGTASIAEDGTPGFVPGTVSQLYWAGGAAGSGNLTANATSTTSFVSFSIDEGQDLAVAFEIDNDAANDCLIEVAAATGFETWYYAGQLADVEDKQGYINYTATANCVGVQTVTFNRIFSEQSAQTVIRCDAGVYIYENISGANTLTRLSDVSVSNVATIGYLDGYTIYGLEDGRFYISAINDATAVNGLDVATAEALADNLIRIWVDRGEIFLFGQLATEVWFNSGNADFPLEPRSFVIPKGILAKFSVASFDNTFGWVGHDGLVYKLDGYNPLRISTHEIERLIRDDPSQSAIRAFAWSRAGHTFYGLTGTDWTRVYDVSTQQWATRKSSDLDYWRVGTVVQAAENVLATDTETGFIMKMVADSFTEISEPIIGEIVSPVMHAFPNGGIVDALHLDFLTGQGNREGAGSEPVLMLDWSNDGGNTFSQEKQLSLGLTGNYAARVTTRRLGRFGPKGRTWRMRISDPVGRSLVGMDAEVRPLKL